MITFKCKCGARYEVDASLAGEKCACDVCNEKFLVPVASGDPSQIADAIMLSAVSAPGPAVPEIETVPTPRPPSDRSGKTSRPPKAAIEKKEKREEPKSVKSAVETPFVPSAKPQPALSSKPKSVKSVSAAIIVILLLAAAGGYLFFSGKQKQTKPKSKVLLLCEDETDEATAVQPQKEDAVTENLLKNDTAGNKPEMLPNDTDNNVSPAPPKTIKKDSVDNLLPVKPSDDALTAYYPLDGSLNNIKDSTLLQIYPPNKAPTYLKGVSGEALLLGKITTEAKIPNTLLNKEEGTVSLWVQMDDDFSSMWGKPILSAKNQEGKKILVLTWNEHRCEFVSQFSNKKFNYLMSDYYLPDRHEWVNVAITWDKKKNRRSMYINGRLTNHFSSLKMPENGSAIESDLAVSVWAFVQNPHLVADELRLYNKALTPSEIKWIVQQYHPVEVKLQNIEAKKRSLMGSPGRSVKVSTTVKLVSEKPFSGILKLETKDKEEKVLWSSDVSVSMTGKGDSKIVTWSVPIPKKAAPAYLTATLQGEKLHPVWGVKVARIPSVYKNKTGQGLPSENLKKILTVNCAKKTNPATFYSNKPTRVVKSKLGKYRETPWEPFTLFAYKFKIKNPGKPHIIRVYYPDDKQRVFALDINDGSGLSPQGAGILTGLRTELTGKMQKQDILFHPETENCLLVVCNWSTDSNNHGSITAFKPKTGAAVAGFEVFEINAEKLPKLPINDNGIDRGRSIGNWVEDAGQTAFWGTPRNDVAAIEGWILSTQNMTEYMDHVGINEYQYPVVWYDGPLFNSPTLFKFNDIPMERIHSHQMGAFDVLLDIFQKHNIKFYPAFYFRNLLALYGQDDIPLPQILDRQFSAEIWAQRYKGEHPAGKDVFQYLWNGKHRMRPYDGNGLPGATAEVGPVFNPLHPSVNKLIMGIYKDWLEQYARHPALGGILLDMGLTWGGVPQADSYSFDRLDSGYGDYTISLFEKDTGIKVPGGKDDDQRFKKRYEFLTSPSMKNKWVKWRCEQIRDKVIMPIYRMVRKYNPKLIIQLGIGSRPGVGPKILNKKLTWMESALECGIDVNMYKKLDNLTFVRHGASFQNPTRCYPLNNLDSYWPNAGFKDCGVLGVTSSYWEMFSHGDLIKPINKKWPEVKPNQLPVRTITDAREGALAHTAYALKKDDIQAIYMTGVGALPTYGHENVIIPFFKAFRALPRKRFSDVPGLDDPVRVRQLTVDNITFIYLVNADSIPHSVTLNFDTAPGSGLDLRTDKKIDIKKPICSVKLLPYQLAAFKFVKPVKVVSGKTDVPESEMKALIARYMSIKRQGQLPHTPEKKGKVYIGVEAEKYTRWESKECYFIDRPSQKIPEELRASVSGNGAIGFGGGSAPAEYDIKFPHTGKYTMWVRFAMPEANKTPSKWEIAVNGKKLPLIESPQKGKPLWVKAGTVDIDKKDSNFTFRHATVAYSIMIDAFLFTDDNSYVPKGGIDYRDKMRAFNSKLTGISKALKLKHVAEAKALFPAIENSVGKRKKR